MLFIAASKEEKRNWLADISPSDQLITGVIASTGEECLPSSDPETRLMRIITRSDPQRSLKE